MTLRQQADHLVEVVHGIEVADPYRWLEAGSDPQTLAWTATQNERTRAALDGLPGRAVLRDRLTHLLSLPCVSAPRLRGSRVFTFDRAGDDQFVLSVRSATDRTVAAQTLLDPVALTGDTSAALDWCHPSRDGALVAYGISHFGDERSTLRLLDVASGEHLDEQIPHTRAASVAWLPDASAFAYTRFPDPAVVGEEEASYHRSVWWHRVGTDPADDEVLWAADELPEPTAWPVVSASPDGRWLLIELHRGPSQVDMHLLDVVAGSRAVVIEGEQAISDLQVVGGQLIGMTTLDASRGRIIAADVRTPHLWRTLVAEPDGADVLEGSVVAGRSLLVASSRDGVGLLHRYDLDGGRRTEVTLPCPGTITGFDGDPTVDRAFVTFTSFAVPPVLLRWDPDGLQSWEPPATEPVSVGLDPDAYTTEAVTYPSKDGVEIPMLLFRRTTTAASSDTAVVLTGYGGFGYVNGPTWSPLSVLVADAGGVAAVAGIRGGGERGEDWHQAGVGVHKQRSFDDFAAAAEWLVGTDRTSPGRLGLRGASNGGLLVAATLTQRPGLCRAVYCAAPLTDMVRYPLFPPGRLWLTEYGDPDVSDDLRRLLDWSPYHRVVDGAPYPAVLISAGAHDSRVDACHARKFAARLQAATSAGKERPVLLHIDGLAGHGIGTPASQQIEDGTDAVAFLLDQLGVEVTGR